MNCFGRIFKVSIFGESHGDKVGIVIDGCPSGLSLSEENFLEDLKRRKPGRKGTTLRVEEDRPFIKSGVFNGKATGAPILILFENKDVDSSDYERNRYTPRPGHADFTAWKKYCGFNDYRGGGHFSGRLTLGLVAAGVIAKKLIRPIRVEAQLVEAGGVDDFERAIEKAVKTGDSIGGIIECRIKDVPCGLGEPFFDSFESCLSHGIFSIPGIKGIEFGAGFGCAGMRGSTYNDQLLGLNGKTKTNNSGGINGGITNGNEVCFRVAVKPTSSIARVQNTVDLRTGRHAEISSKGRHDICIALRVPVIVEAVTAMVVADFMLIDQKLLRVLDE